MLIVPVMAPKKMAPYRIAPFNGISLQEIYSYYADTTIYGIV